MPEFVPGLVLAERFYREAVRPVLDEHFPGVPHAAALIGGGSEVLGFDTPVSTDHHWGPRGLLFLDEDTHARHAAAIDERLRDGLPHRFLGWPTSFAEPDPRDPGTRLLMETTDGPVRHRVEVVTLRDWIRAELGLELTAEPTPADWLSFPSQKLRSLVGGAVFHDDLGLGALRERFAWYPPDVWRWMLASGWQRIGQEEHLMGRAAQSGDELGSRLIAARLVRDLMRLGFLMERVYAPYPKWFGTAYARLAMAPELQPLLEAVLDAPRWPERDRALAPAYERLARRQNGLALCAPVPEQVEPFWGRPFSVIRGSRIAEALRASIEDPAVRALGRPIGNVDQWSDSTDVLVAPELRARVAGMYGPRAQ